MQLAPLTGTATRISTKSATLYCQIQPAPLTGTATEPSETAASSAEDTARAPYGDGNSLSHASVALVLD